MLNATFRRRRGVALLLLVVLSACQKGGLRGQAAGQGANAPATDVRKTEELAQTAYNAGDWAAAEPHYVALAEAIPQEPDLWFKLGNIYARTDRPELAVASYREALVRDPKLGKAWFNMGIVQLRQAANSFHKMDVHVAEGDPSREQADKAYAAILEILDEGESAPAEAGVTADGAAPADPAGGAATESPAGAPHGHE